MDVYRALWRGKYLIVVLTAFVTVVAFYLSASQKKVYTTSTLVRIQQQVTDPGQAYTSLAVGQELAKTYAAIVKTSTIRAGVRASLGGRVRGDEVNIGASPVEDLALLQIYATSHDPQVAAEVTNATPGVLKKFIAESGTINDQIVTISRASVPSSSISPRPLRTALLALLLGLIFNAGLALLIEFFRDRLPDVEEIEEVFGKPVLASIPVLAFTSVTTNRLDSELDRIGRPDSVAPVAEEVVRRTHQPRKQGVEGVG